jgi:T-complex protein 1 subunit eta
VFVNAYARALEVIPRQLCDNAGFDATDVLSRLRNKHAQSEDRGKHFGIDISTGAQLQQQCVAHRVVRWFVIS